MRPKPGDDKKRPAPSAKAALARAAALCDRAETCSSEIEARLSRWGLEEDDIRAVLGKLIELGYVDDRRYARAFAHSKMAYSGWGKFKISMGLRAKGIGRELISEALDMLDLEEYEAVAERVVRAKLRQTGGNAADYTTRMKVLRFAAGRGFETQLIVSILQNIASADR